MLTSAAFLVAGFFAAIVWRLPRALLKRYCASFRARHGAGVQVGLVVLGTMTGSMLLAATLHPGQEAMELVTAAVVTGLALAALLDLYLFGSRR